MYNAVDSQGVLDGYFGLMKGGMEEKDRSEDQGGVPVSFDGMGGIKSGLGEEPGSSYKMWTEANGEYGLLVKRGCELLGVSEEYLCSVVVSSERKMKRAVMS